MRLLPIVALLMLAISPSDDRLDQLARSGNIEENAPVKASLEIAVNASPEKVWRLLTDVKNWPRWQRDISKAGISGPLQSGTAFTWTAGVEIRSRIALVQPVEQFDHMLGHYSYAIDVQYRTPLPGSGRHPLPPIPRAY